MKYIVELNEVFQQNNLTSNQLERKVKNSQLKHSLETLLIGKKLRNILLKTFYKLHITFYLSGFAEI